MIPFAKVTVIRGSLVISCVVIALLSSQMPVFSQALPELPQVFLNTPYEPPAVPPGRLIRVPQDIANFQTALNAAQPGDIIELEAGQTFTGNFVLPAKTGTGWIYIRSSAHESLPSPGRRVSPSRAALMPKIVTATTDPAIRTSPGSHHYRFVGIEITTTSSLVWNLIWLDNMAADSGPPNEAHIVFDRSYIHGTPTANVRRGIALNGKRTAFIDSYLSDFHEDRAMGGDSQAVGGWNGPGPFKIVNNYLEGATENLIFGGADPSFSQLVPADIEIRRNHFFKPLSWRGGPWTVKNLFELKNARRVLVEANVLENNWADAQAGTAILFTVRNQDGQCPWCVVEDVTFQKNILRHTAGGFAITGTDNNHPSQQAARILIRDNLLYDIDPSRFGGGGCSRIFQLGNVDSPDPSQPGGIRDLIVNHNTGRIQGACTSTLAMGDSTELDDKHQGPIFRNNLLQRGTYGVFGSGVGEGTASLNAFSVNWTFEKNVIIGAPASSYPPQNFFPATDDDVGFVDWRNDDYRLAPTSPYNNAGTDGKDIGADIDAVMAATAGVVSGVSNRAPFTGTPFPVPGLFQAEDFDLGGEGVAYHDAVPGNAGGLYRTSEDVDIIAARGNATGYVVNNIQTGEWLEYTIDVATAGTYSIELNVSSEFTTSQFHVEIDGVDVTGSVLVPNTGWWGTFQFVGTSGVNLSAGQHVLRVYAEQEYFNLDAIQIQ